MQGTTNRRKFIGQSFALGAGLMLSSTLGFSSHEEKKIRIGMIGVGMRGTNHLQNLLNRTDVLIPAICDIDTERITIAQDMLVKAGHQKAEAYTKNDHSFLEMLK